MHPRLWKGKLNLLRAGPGRGQRLALPPMPLLSPQEKAAARERLVLRFPQPQQRKESHPSCRLREEPQVCIVIYIICI